MSFPMPNEPLYGRIVIASVYYTDDVATVLLLNRKPPYFSVGQLTLNDAGRLTIWDSHENIVPAVRQYEDMGGDY